MMRVTCRRAAPSLLVLLLMLLSGASPLAACLTYIDLWERIGNADLILFAEVEKAEPTVLGRWLDDGGNQSLWSDALSEMVPSSWRLQPPLWLEPPRGRLVLRPLESWKGPSPRRLRVGTSWLERELAGQEVVVFVHRGLWGWTVDWLVRRALLQQAGGSDVLRRWVELAVELQRRSPGSGAARIEWLMDGYSTASLRPWAVYELAAEVTPRRKAGADPPLRLTQAQQAAIAASFAADPPGDRELIPTLRLLAGYEDPLVDQVLVGVVSELLAKPCADWRTSEAVYLSLERFGADEALSRLQVEDRWHLGVGEIRRIWKLGLEEAGSNLVPDLGDRLAVDGQIPAARVAEGGEGDLEAGGV